MRKPLLCALALLAVGVGVAAVARRLVDAPWQASSTAQPSPRGGDVIAIAVGITMFNDQSHSSNRDAVSNDLMTLCSRSQQWAIKPESMGGGGGDFQNGAANMVMSDITTWDVDANGVFGDNENGVYTLAVGPLLVTITGTGNQGSVVVATAAMTATGQVGAINMTVTTP